MPYRVTITRMRGDTPIGVVTVEVPDRHPWDRTWGVQVADFENPGETISLFDEDLRHAAVRGDYGLKVVDYDWKLGLENLKRDMEVEHSGHDALVANAPQGHE